MSLYHPDGKIMNEPRNTSRDHILDAAQKVAERDGAGNLTLEKVACECGLSKGGLLYNFPNKDSLLQGMLERLISQQQQIMDTERETVSNEPNACTRSMLRAMACQQMVDPGVYTSILAASAQKPALLEPVRQSYAENYQCLLSESTDPELSLLFWAAADGIMFHSILGINPYPNEMKAKLFRRLLQISEELL